MSHNPSVPKPNHTEVPNVILDHYLAIITPAETKVLLWLCRKTRGWHIDWTDSRYSTLGEIAKFTGLSKNGVMKALRGLYKHQLVKWRKGSNGTRAKSYGLRTEGEPAEGVEPEAIVHTVGYVPPAPNNAISHSGDEQNTLSGPSHSIALKKPIKENKEMGSSVTAATPSQDIDTSGGTAKAERVCANALCSQSLDGRDKRYRYCCSECRTAASKAGATSTTDPRVPVLVRDYAALLGYPVDPYPAYAAAAKVLLRSYPPVCILATYQALKAEPGGYWVDRPLSLMSLRKQIGPALAGGQVPGWRLENGEAIEVDEDAERRSSRGTDEHNAKALRMLVQAAEKRGDTQGAAELQERLEAIAC